MKKKLVGRLLSLSLSVVLAVTSFSAPAYAAESDLELSESEVTLEEETPEEILDGEDEEEATAEEEAVSEEEAPTEDEISEAEEAPAEDEYPAEEEFPANEEAPAEEVTEEEDIVVEESAEALTEEAGKESAEPKTDSEEASKGFYYLKFNAGIPEGCLQKNLWGYYDGQVIPTEIGASIVLSGDEFELPGYELVGWNYKDASGKDVKINSATATIPSLTDKEGETFEFTPVWKLGEYTITYDFNGGTSTGKSVVTYKLDKDTINQKPLYNYVASGDSFVINTENPEVTRDGFIFTGWNGYYNDERYYGGTTFRDMTLRAQWTGIKYPLNWDGNGGTVYGEKVYSYQTTLEGGFSSWKAVRQGYTHKGWKTMVKGKEKIYKVSDIIWTKELDRGADDSYTLTAVWEANKYNLTYVLNEGKITKAPKSFKTGDGTVIPDPVRDGYRFTGWTVDVFDPETEEFSYVSATEMGYIKDGRLTEAANHNLELIAGWEELSYDITFKNSDGSDLVDAEGNPIDRYTVSYFDDVDFTDYAWIIESKGALADNVSIAGFALTPNAKKPKYKLGTTYSKFLPKKSEGESSQVPLTLYIVPQDKVYRISYSTDGGTVKKPVYTYTDKNVKKDYAIKAVASRTGFSFAGWKTYEQFDEYVVKDANGYVKAIKAGSAVNIILLAEYVNENTYTITLMPGAGDVKDSDGKLIDKKKGLQFRAGDVTTFRYSDDSVILFDYFSGWTREGYQFAGFYKDTKHKNYTYTTGGLGNGKSKNVKLYAYWVPSVQTISLSDTGLVYRGDDSYEIADANIEAPLYGSVVTEYGKKDFVPYKLKAKGFNFLGWQVIGDLSDDSGIEYTDASRKYVKKIKKTNKENITLQAVFSEISYKIYVNPNGGEYKGSKGKVLVSDKVYYGQQCRDAYFDIVNNTVRAGYRIQYASTTMDYKGDIRQTVRDQSGKQDYFYKNRLADKQDAKVIVNVLWYKVDPVVPSIHKHSVRIEEDTLTLQCSYTPSKDYSRLVFEYSTSADFSKNVKTYAWEEAERDENNYPVYPTVKVTPGKNYYVRVRQEVIDSTGDYFAGEWSHTVMATNHSSEY